MNTKQCKTCGETKLLEAFRKSACHRQGVKSDCKECEYKLNNTGGSKFNDEAPLDWRDDDLEVKNRAESWARYHGRTAIVKASMRLP